MLALEDTRCRKYRPSDLAGVWKRKQNNGEHHNPNDSNGKGKI